MKRGVEKGRGPDQRVRIKRKQRHRIKGEKIHHTHLELEGLLTDRDSDDSVGKESDVKDLERNYLEAKEKYEKTG